MRIVLERDDLVHLLGKALNVDLTSDDVKISTDPFEVTIYKAEQVVKAPSEDEKEGPPESAKPVKEPESEPEVPLGDLLGASDALASVGPSTGGDEGIAVPPPTVGGREQ